MLRRAVTIVCPPRNADCRLKQLDNSELEICCDEGLNAVPPCLPHRRTNFVPSAAASGHSYKQFL